MNASELKQELRNNIELLRGNPLRLTVDKVTKQYNTLRDLGNAILEVENEIEKAYFFPSANNAIIIHTKKGFTQYMNINFKN